MENLRAKKYAEDLVNQFKIILQDEDTDCGQEILCTLIGIKCARVTVNRLLDCDSGDHEFFNDVLKELDKI